MVKRPVRRLFVDSEAGVTESSPWAHVKKREGDGWKKPEGASDDQLHLMVQCMETWFLADREVMREFFGDGDNEGALPTAAGKLEDVSTGDLAAKLKAATRHTKTKGVYNKGKHSFELLALLDRKAPSDASRS